MRRWVWSGSFVTEGPIVDTALIHTLFKPEELKFWFGTTDIRDDDGTGHTGTIIDPSTAREIYWRYHGKS